MLCKETSTCINGTLIIIHYAYLTGSSFILLCITPAYTECVVYFHNVTVDKFVDCHCLKRCQIKYWIIDSLL